MKRRRGWRFRLVVAAGAVAAGLMILFLASWLVYRGQVRLSQGETYHYGQTTIVVDSFEEGHLSQGYRTLSGYFPIVRLTVKPAESCSLLLEPTLGLAKLTRRIDPAGNVIKEEVDLAEGHTRTISWTFEVVPYDDAAATLTIEVHDRTGELDPGKVIFRLKEPAPINPLVPPTTAGQ